MAAGERGVIGGWRMHYFAQLLCGRLGGLRRVSLLVIALLLLGGGAAPAMAQAIKGRIILVGIGGNNGEGGLYRPGFWVPVQVVLQNRTGKDFEGHLAVEQKDLDGDHVTTISPTFVLNATDDNRILWAYYWPAPDDDLSGIKSVLVMDKNNVPITNIALANQQAAPGGIPLEDRNDRSARFVLVLGTKAMGWSRFQEAHGGTEAVRFAAVADPLQIPDDVKGLESVDVIVWRADEMKVSDIPSDFQRKAMLEWVKAGGHLIISVGQQGQEFLKAGGSLADAMPMAFSGSRQLPLQQLAPFKGCTILGGRPGIGQNDPILPSNVPFLQATGTMKPGARVVSCCDFPPFDKDPLAVTALCGRGAVTVLTMDAANPEMERLLDDKAWMLFWSQIAGWQSKNIVTAAEVTNGTKVSIPPRQIILGQGLGAQIDVKDVTELRILVAVLFLAAYWLIAGPVGHLVLKQYKVVHWSWWIFGATVVVATTAAGAVVLGLHVGHYDVRHRSFVLGTVNSPDVTVLGVYGIYAPTSGPLEIAQPESPGGGMNYLMPLSIPSLTQEDIKGFADTQSYDVALEHPNVIAPVYRNTLKKLEGRWTGARPGIDGQAAYTGIPTQELRGQLVNNSGYDLDGVQIIVHRSAPLTQISNPVATQGDSHLYVYNGTWKKGTGLSLDTDLALETFGVIPRPGTAPPTVEKFLQVTGWKIASEGRYGGGMSASDFLPEERVMFSRPPNDELLYLLLDARSLDYLQESGAYQHHEPVRGIARLLDSTKALYAAGALVVAHAGSIADRDFVNTPVPLTVAGHTVEGKGEVLFAWALPVSGLIVSDARAIEAEGGAAEIPLPGDRPGPARGGFGIRGRGVPAPPRP